MPVRLFISHSSSDADLAERLVALVRAGLHLRAGEVRCTSVDGYRLPAGASTGDQLRREVVEADVCLGVVTPGALDSLYVAFELGARWGADRPLVPLLAPGVPASVLGGPLKDLNALQCTRPQLQQLVTDLAGLLGVDPEPPHVYDRYIDAVVSAGAAPDPHSAPSAEGPPVAPITPLPDLALLTHPEGEFVVAEIRRVEAKGPPDPWSTAPASVLLDVAVEDGRSTSTLRSLPRAGSGAGLSYGDEAYLGQVTEAVQTREGGASQWRLTFQPNEGLAGGPLGDIATDGYSGDDIAELRARRILLGEELPGRRGGGYDTLDGLVGGLSGSVQVKKSPFPDLYEQFGTADPRLFLAVCRLVAVLLLKGTGTVADVWRLDLALEDGGVRVDFEGQRRKQYANADPPVIQVSGVCPLGSVAGRSR